MITRIIVALFIFYSGAYAGIDYAYGSAIAAAQTGDWKKAQQGLTAQVVDAPDRADLLYDNGVASYRLSEFEKAAAYFQSVAKSDTASADLKKQAYFNLGNTHVALKNLQEAIADYQAVLDIDSENEPAKHNLEKVRQMLAQQQQQDNQNNDQNDDQNQDQQKKGSDQNKKDSQHGDSDDKNQESNDSNEQSSDNGGNEKDQQKDNKQDDKKNQESSGGKQEKEQSSDQQQEGQEENDSDNKSNEQQSNNQQDDFSDGHDSSSQPEQSADQSGQQPAAEPDSQASQEDEKEQEIDASTMDDGENERLMEEQQALEQKLGNGKKWMARLLDRQEKEDEKAQKQLVKATIDKQLAGQHGQNCW